MSESNLFGTDLLIPNPNLLVTMPWLLSKLPDALAPSALNLSCRVAKLSSPDILKLIFDNKVCPSCTHPHDPAYHCRLTFHSGASKVCPRGCMHNSVPVHRRACMHSNQAPTVSISKVGSNRSIPLVENIPLVTSSLRIQYDTGCELSLISQ